MSGAGDKIDAFVHECIPHTNGFLYGPIQFHLPRYPIPELRLDPGGGKHPLDNECNWADGRSPRRERDTRCRRSTPQSILTARNRRRSSSAAISRDRAWLRGASTSSAIVPVLLYGADRVYVSVRKAGGVEVRD